MLNTERISRIVQRLPSHVKIRRREDGSPRLATVSDVRNFMMSLGAMNDKMMEETIRGRYPALIRTEHEVLYLENENFQ